MDQQVAQSQCISCGCHGSKYLSLFAASNADPANSFLVATRMDTLIHPPSKLTHSDDGTLFQTSLRQILDLGMVPFAHSYMLAGAKSIVFIWTSSFNPVKFVH
jgi:hypothetical protein